MCENCKGKFEILYTLDGILKFCKECITRAIKELGLNPEKDIFRTYNFGNLTFETPEFIRNGKSFYRGIK